ncbi:hypothetical protein FIU88_18470 (plasmid) [Halomonas sp. THAF12]|uniref:hypothetical protein n=1 Tax=Halomonas sp. THAF12 TaxID=2587849 RepID=UPI001268E3D1|nr:hypothetical protein [Halomonas sp. THAF12]QFT86937.1 hypothetical protein FIU88_18470 [Halomonas sp. THAF12]
MKTINAVRHHDADAGQAWLEVPKPIVKGLGIDNAISRKCLVDATSVFLTEPRDSRLVKLALDDKHAEVEITEQPVAQESLLYDLSSYTPARLGDQVTLLEDRLIDLPRIEDLGSEKILEIASQLQDRAQRYCNVMLPEHEWVSDLLQFKKGLEAEAALRDCAAHTSTIGMMTEVRRGNNEGYVCTAYLTRALSKAGLVAVPLVIGKFWSWEQADQLSKKIQEWYCW